MKPIFNISSTGGSATTWLTDVVNKHPDIVAFHGLRTNPLDRGEWLAPARVIELCMALRDHQGGNLCTEVSKKTYGIIHTFNGTEIRDDILSVGGGFMAIFRDPVMRINSLFHHHYRDIMNNKVVDNDIYGTVVAKGHVTSAADDYYANKLSGDDARLTSSEKMFAERVREILSGDYDNYSNSSESEWMLFEKMVTSAPYCYERLSGLIGMESELLYEIVKESIDKIIFSHSRQKSDQQTVFSRWPVQFKMILWKEANKIGLQQCRDMYKNLGYMSPGNDLFGAY